MLMGKAMRLSTVNEKVATLDEVWQELSELAPEYFPKDMNELELILYLHSLPNHYISENLILNFLGIALWIEELILKIM